MEYKISKSDKWDITLEKHMESKGFFRNVSGSSKVGGIRLLNDTEEEWFEDFLTEEDGTYYMELGCIKGFNFIYRGEAPRVFIGDNIHNIPVEERIKFLYESLNANANYNCLAIMHKDPEPAGHALYGTGHKKSLFEINKGAMLFDDIVTFNVSDL